MSKTTGNESGRGAAPMGTANVVPLRGQPQRAEPPPGWVVDSPYGHLRCDATPAGRLVRLADVVLWLMGSPKELPRKAAIEAVCSALTPELYGRLYMLRKADYAQPVGVDCMWGYQTDAQYREGVERQAQDHRQKQFEDDQRSAWRGGFGTPRPSLLQARQARTGEPASSPPAYVAPAPGLPALIACIKYRLTKPHRIPEKDSLRNPSEYLAGLAIPINQAHATWGYGVVHQLRSLRPTDKAAEPVQWVERSTVGLHRANDTPEGRLVRLADLVRWLMATYQLPRVEALEHVLDRFNFDRCDWLYRVSAGGYAQPKNGASGFLRFVSIEGLTTEQIAAMPAEQLVVFHARDCLRRVWGDASQPDTVLDSTEPYRCDGYAITLALAGEWFGYRVVGESEAPSTVIERENTADTDEWSGERLAAEMKALKLAGVKAYTQALVQKSGIKEREIRRRIAGAPEASTPKNSVFDNAKKTAVRR